MQLSVGSYLSHLILSKLYCVDINCEAREDTLEGDTNVQLLVVMAARFVLFCSVLLCFELFCFVLYYYVLPELALNRPTAVLQAVQQQ